ncbi:MAG: alpha/beta hydrolase [Mycobacterium sp.]|nr:MAG: alpha/beta hydrolase [Mycobacterium sp.]
MPRGRSPCTIATPSSSSSANPPTRWANRASRRCCGTSTTAEHRWAGPSDRPAEIVLTGLGRVYLPVRRLTPHRLGAGSTACSPPSASRSVPAMGDDIQFVDANGLRFAYLEEGSGPLVLMLHGFPDTAHSWDDLRPRIAAKGYRAVSPFMRGYHPSGIPDDDADQETLARDPLGLMDALDAQEAILIGHDWGASAAYGAAGLAPERVRKLFVIGIPHPAAVKPSLKKIWGVRHFAAYKLPGAPNRFARNDFAALPAIYRRWSPAWNPDPGEFAAVRASFAVPASLNAAFGYYRKLSPIPSASLKAKITVPTVVFAGLDDPIVDPSDYRFAARMFENEYTVEELPGGHFMHREHPEMFADRLLGHL